MRMKEAINDFVGGKTLAVVGVSRDPKRFGHMAYRALKDKGYRVVPVNPFAQAIAGEVCYPKLTAVREPIDGALLVTPKAQTEGAVRDALAAGIRRIWIQQRSETSEALRCCEEAGVTPVHGQCILMHTEPTGFHKFHRTLARIFGRLPR
jgi:predicted CoA-binding protein